MLAGTDEGIPLRHCAEMMQVLHHRMFFRHLSNTSLMEPLICS